MAARSTITLGVEVSGGEAFKAALRACDAETKALNAELQRLATSQAAADRGSQGMAQRMQLLGQAVETGKQKLTLLGQELDKAKQHLNTLAQELERAKASNDPEAINRAATAYERQRTVVANLETNIARTRQSTDEAANAMQRMSGSNIAAGFERIKTATAAVAHGMAEVAKAAANAANEIINKMNTAVVGLTAAGSAVLVGLGKVGLTYNSQMEQYVTNFGTLLGSTEAAAKKVEELKKMAASTPFGMEDLANATQTLLAFGVEADKTTPILKALGDVSLGNKDRFQSLALAFGQVSSAGKLTGQDLNQMINAGFNPLQEISKMTGKSMAELKDEMAKGAITAEMVEQAFIHATSAGGQFENGMQAASQTMSGMISTLKDNATALVGQVFQPISDSIKNTLLPAALGYIEQLTNAFEKDGLPGLIRAVGDCLDQIVAKIETEGPKLIQKAVDIITQIAQRLTQSLPEMVRVGRELVENIMEGLRTTLPQLGPIAAQIAPLVVETVIKYKSELLNAGITIITNILEGLAQHSSEIVSTMQDCLNRLIDTIISNLPSILDSATKIIQSLAEGLIKNADKIVSAINDVINQLVDWVIDNLDLILDVALKLVMSLAQGIIDNTPKAIDATIRLVNSLIDWILTNLDLIIDAALKMIIALTEGMLQATPKVIDAISQIVQKLLQWILDNLDKVVDTITKFVETMARTLIDNLPKIIDAISKLVMSLCTWIIEHLDQVILAAVQIVVAIAKGIIQSVGQAVEAIGTVTQSIWQAIMEFIGQIPELGRNLITGLWNGIIGAKDWLMERLRSLLEWLPDWAKHLLGINSPSKVFADIGEDVGLGLAQGIMSTAKTVQDAMDYITPGAGNITMGADMASVAGRLAEADGYTPFADDRPIIIQLNERELGRAVRGYA